jgi:hypothetical protein
MLSTGTGDDDSPVMRSYTGFSQAAEKNGVSRILNGFHFRKAVEEGIEHGEKIGERAVDRVLRLCADTSATTDTAARRAGFLGPAGRFRARTAGSLSPATAKAATPTSGR